MTMPDYIRDAIAAQGKVDPDEVAELAADVDLDAWPVPTPTWQHDPGPEPDRPEFEPQGQLLDPEERGYGYEP